MLSAKVLPKDSEWVVAQVVDASAGGAGLSFPADKDPMLEADDLVTLSFSSLREATEVLAQAVVRTRADEEAAVRYGFQFSDPAQLFKGLDPFYLKFFNRRRHLRVRPQLGRNMNVDVRTEEGGWRLRLHDVSQAGLSIMVSSEELRWVQENERFDIEFKVPGSEASFATFARRVHFTNVGGSLRCGLEFELPRVPEGTAPPPVGQQLMNIQGATELKEWIESREREMARWDTAYN